MDDGGIEEGSQEHKKVLELEQGKLSFCLW